MRTCARPPRAEPHRTLCTALLEIQRNQNRGNGNWSVGNVSSLSIRKASAVGERWATGASAQPTVHRLVLWAAQLSIAGAHTTTIVTSVGSSRATQQKSAHGVGGKKTL